MALSSSGLLDGLGGKTAGWREDLLKQIPEFTECPNPHMYRSKRRTLPKRSWLFHSPSLFTKHHAQFNDWTMMSKIEPSGGNCTGREGDVVPMLLSTSNLVKHQAAVRSKQYCATSGTVCNFAKKIPRPHLLFELCTSEIEEEYDKKWEAVALPFCLLGCEMVSDGAA